MLAITSCAERIRSVLDIFVHPMTLLKLQSMLNLELVPARGGFCVIATHLIDFRLRRKLDGSNPTSSLQR
jgi:hypothetical protein